MSYEYKPGGDPLHEDERYQMPPVQNIPPQPPRQPRSKGDNELVSWLVIAAMFAFGLWPIGLFMLFGKLGDNKTKTKTTVRTTTRTTTTAAAPEVKSQEMRTETTVKSEKTERVEKKLKSVTKPTKTTSKSAGWLVTVGIVVAAIAGLNVMDVLPDFLHYGTSYVWELVTSVGWAVGGLAMIFGGNKMQRRQMRFVRYIAAIGERRSISFKELQDVMHVSRKTVLRDLDTMLSQSWFGASAYMDAGREMLFLDAKAASEHISESKAEEKLTPEEVNEGYSGVLRSIRYANDRIPDPVLSAKIDRLETVAGRILSEVEAHPEKKPQASRFFNYYLPTTLKLLDSYADFDAAGIEGENLRQAKARIEETMDNLIAGFEKQLDELYRSEARDIDSEIRVMETMLAQDTGSVEKDFGLSSAKANAPIELDLGGVAAQEQQE